MKANQVTAGDDGYNDPSAISAANTKSRRAQVKELYRRATVSQQCNFDRAAEFTHRRVLDDESVELGRCRIPKRLVPDEELIEYESYVSRARDPSHGSAAGGAQGGEEVMTTVPVAAAYNHKEVKKVEGWIGEYEDKFDGDEDKPFQLLGLDPSNTAPRLLGMNRGVALRLYQVAAVAYIIQQWVKQRSVLLGDHMGLGKTISALAGILFDINTAESEAQDEWWLPTLVIVPPALVMGWLAEAKAVLDASRFNVEYLDSTKKTEKGSFATPDATRAALHTIWIATADVLKNRAAEDLKFRNAVVDEAHERTLTAGSKGHFLRSIKALHRAALSGIPARDKTHDLQQIFDFLFPDGDSIWPDELPRNADEKADLYKSMLHETMIARTRASLFRNKRLIDLPPQLPETVEVPLTEKQKVHVAEMIDNQGRKLFRSTRGGNERSFAPKVFRLMSQASIWRFFQYLGDLDGQETLNKIRKQITESERDPTLRLQTLISLLRVELKKERIDLGYNPAKMTKDAFLRRFLEDAPKLAQLVFDVSLRVNLEQAKVAVWSYWPWSQYIAQLLLQAFDIPTVAVWSGQSKRQPQESLADFENPENRTAMVICALTRVSGFGHNWQHACHVVITVEQTFTHGEYLQQIMRVRRDGQTHPQTFLTYLLANGMDIQSLFFKSAKQYAIVAMYLKSVFPTDEEEFEDENSDGQTAIDRSTAESTMIAQWLNIRAGLLNKNLLKAPHISEPGVMASGSIFENPEEDEMRRRLMELKEVAKSFYPIPAQETPYRESLRRALGMDWRDRLKQLMEMERENEDEPEFPADLSSLFR